MRPRSRRDQHDQPVPVEPLHGREQRLGRRAVGPVQVLDHDHDRPVILELRPLFEDLHSRSEALVGRGPQLAGKLEGSSAGELVGRGHAPIARPGGRCATTCRTSAVFPMPASPSIHTTSGWPDAVSSSARAMDSRSALLADQLT